MNWTDLTLQVAVLEIVSTGTSGGRSVPPVVGVRPVRLTLARDESRLFGRVLVMLIEKMLYCAYELDLCVLANKSDNSFYKL